MLFAVYGCWRNNEVTKAAREVEVPRYLTVLYSINFIGFDISGYANIIRWMEKMSERPAYKKMVSE